MEEDTVQPEVMFVDTITKLDDSHRGNVVVGASHGGVYAGYCAAKGGVRGVILNDAGIGKDRAGLGSLAYMDGLNIPAATADHMSCRIADSRDMRENGIVSFVNRTAEALGCAPGQAVMECARHMLKAELANVPVPKNEEARFIIRDNPGEPRVIGMDSASLVEADDAGCIIITASHGALLGGKPDSAVAPDVLAAIFNDAGLGKDRIGISRLKVLDERGIAAATVAAESARIGDARSAYEEGRLSHVNDTAVAWGIEPGMSTKTFVELVTAKVR